MTPTHNNNTATTKTAATSTTPRAATATAYNRVSTRIDNDDAQPQSCNLLSVLSAWNSFMLLIISSIELLNLLAIALGSTDDDGYGLYEHWGWAQTVDLLVSIAGVYVAIMGFLASTKNTLRLARIYSIGTFFVGVGWLLFNYVEINESIEADHEKNHPIDDYVPKLSTSSVMVLPAMVWVMCCSQAALFHHCIRSELERSSNNSNNNIYTASVTANTENDTAAADRDSSDPESGIEDGPELELIIFIRTQRM